MMKTGLSWAENVRSIFGYPQTNNLNICRKQSLLLNDLQELIILLSKSSGSPELILSSPSCLFSTPIAFPWVSKPGISLGLYLETSKQQSVTS